MEFDDLRMVLTVVVNGLLCACAAWQVYLYHSQYAVSRTGSAADAVLSI